MAIGRVVPNKLKWQARFSTIKGAAKLAGAGRKSIGEAYKFAAIAAALCLLFAFLAWETIAWPMGLLTLCVAAFFRDPERVTPQGDRLVVAPADGLVTLIQKVPPPRELAMDDGSGTARLGEAPVTRVSIFMSVFDVHINRTPVGGTVRRVVYIPGRFLNADLDKASEENERQHILVERSDGSAVGFTQIAGLVARRIVPFVKAGDILAAGQRVGLIRFGSRVDVYLPEGTEPRVIMGQKVIAGETVLAEIGESRKLEGVFAMSDGDRLAQRRLPGGLTLRAMVPNAITAAALCVGLTGIRFAISGDYERSVQMVILAGLLDGIDGRAARLLKAQSRFGAELDSLADSISFGVAPALIIYLWTLQSLPSIGWLAALAFAICCVLRLARFNARLDTEEQPHKSAGFLTGVPAPVGAGLAFLPMYLWVASGEAEIFASPVGVGIWLALIAFLMISSVPTLSWGKLRPRRSIRLEMIALAGLVVAALVIEPWLTLVAISVGYLALIPIGLISYARVKRQRRLAATNAPGDFPTA